MIPATITSLFSAPPTKEVLVARLAEASEVVLYENEFSVLHQYTIFSVEIEDQVIVLMDDLDGSYTEIKFSDVDLEKHSFFRLTPVTLNDLELLEQPILG